MLVPKLVTTLRSYDLRQFSNDAVAGVIVGIVALPLAIAFAIASGVTPDRGLWTAIIAGFVISAFGGSRVQIGGPTGAFVVIVYGIVQKYGTDGLMIATIMAGGILIVMGFARLGSAIKFIPRPLVTGFTSGIAVIIFSGEIKDVLGLKMGAVPAAFLAKWPAYASASALTWQAVGVAGGALLIIFAWPRINRRIPGPFVALIVTTIAARLLHLPIETIGSRFGAISASVPHPAIPHVTAEQFTALVGPAFTIALLAAVESLLSAVVADGMIGGRHRSNMELIAQGVANIASPLFGGIPATGAIARTATNVKNGARTPVAGMIHAATLLLITLVAGQWAALIPMATLAAILIAVSYHMSEWRAFVSELQAPRSDVAVLLSTFLLTVLVDLTVAVSVGMVLASFLFIRRMAAVTTINAVTPDMLCEREGNDDLDAQDGVQGADVPRGVEVYEINGPFFFGAAAMFKDNLSRIADIPAVLILRMRHVPVIDSSGMHALREVVVRARQEGTAVILSELRHQPAKALADAGILRELGASNTTPDFQRALSRAHDIVATRSGGTKRPSHSGQGES